MYGLNNLALDKMAAISQTTFSNAFLQWKKSIPIEIQLKFAPKGVINSIAALVQIMAWCRSGGKPSFEQMMTQFTDVYTRH